MNIERAFKATIDAHRLEEVRHHFDGDDHSTMASCSCENGRHSWSRRGPTEVLEAWAHHVISETINLIVSGGQPCNGKCGNNAPLGYEFCIGCAHGVIALNRLAKESVKAERGAVVRHLWRCADADVHPDVTAVIDRIAKEIERGDHHTEPVAAERTRAERR